MVGHEGVQNLLAAPAPLHSSEEVATCTPAGGDNQHAAAAQLVHLPGHVLAPLRGPPRPQVDCLYSPSGVLKPHCCVLRSCSATRQLCSAPRQPPGLPTTF